VISAVVPSIAASRTEQQRHMSGDGIVPQPMFTVTHAITIDAPSERVWPWIAQMGSLRGGWYSYDRIDNGGIPSADRALEEYQQLEVGDVLPSLPGATDSFIVAAVAPPRDLILTVPGAGGVVTSWEHLLEPMGTARSRLIVRSRVARGWAEMARGAQRGDDKLAFIEYVYRILARIPGALMIAIGRLGHRWMEARHMRGIKRRAEAVL
jgi:hypothetical protein